MVSGIFEAVPLYLGKWSTFLIVILVSLVVIKKVKAELFKSKHGAKKAPDMGVGYFGVKYIAGVLKAKENGDLMEYFRKHSVTNKPKTQTFTLLGIDMVMSRHPENVKALLATQFNDFDLGLRHAHLAPLLGDGIFTLDGEGWKHSRAMLRPQFARDQVAHVEGLESHIQLLAKHIAAAKGNTFDLQELFFKFTVDTSTEFLFGESINSLYDEKIGITPRAIEGITTFAESFNKSQTYLASRAYLQSFYFILNGRQFHEWNKDVHTVAKYFVKRALSFSPAELEEKSKNSYVFLYELAKQTRDPQVLQDQLLNILVAGRDTTAGLLSFTFYQLARNPEIFEKLKTEVYKHFGNGTDLSKITFESLKQCEYLKFVLNEVLRLHPSVPLNFRVANKDTTLPVGGGKDGRSPVYVPKGTSVGYSVFFTHRDPEVYGKDAEDFRPERWSELRNLGWAYLPFNGGPRICLGQQFALTEASYVIVRLLQLFPNLESSDAGTYPPKYCVHLTMSLHDGASVKKS
ncbi:cytochrome P450 52A13 (DH-ALK2) [Scheffersomyces xylosifermentans]|uniref:cytochrome P450 52A13 (DH-ALK2) n=1 Tax=Scheffersomyces xylosifermentans TaxID=1304137 RepID=UPI00315C6A71